MPTYEYKCEKCGMFEVSQRITEDALTACPTCSGSVERLISASAFHLKGGGWYKTDYAASSSPAASNPQSSEGVKSGETKTEVVKTEVAPAPPAPAVPTTTSGES